MGFQDQDRQLLMVTMVLEVIFDFVILVAFIAISYIVYNLFRKSFGNHNQSIANSGNNQLEVIVDNNPKKSGESGFKATKSRSDGGTHTKRPEDHRRTHSFVSKLSKTSDSKPESSSKQQSYRMEELMHRMGSGSDDRSEMRSDCSQTDVSIFSDTIIKMDRVIDQTFESILESVDPPIYNTSDEDI